MVKFNLRYVPFQHFFISYCTVLELDYNLKGYLHLHRVKNIGCFQAGQIWKNAESGMFDQPIDVI